MNQLEAVVIKVMSKKPGFRYDKYWMKVEYVCYGLSSTMDLMFDTKEEAMAMGPGHKFKA